eukprot:8527020-Alexandrium_andersonii.AAC.1
MSFRPRSPCPARRVVRAPLSSLPGDAPLLAVPRHGLRLPQLLAVGLEIVVVLDLVQVSLVVRRE